MLVSFLVLFIPGTFLSNLQEIALAEEKIHKPDVTTVILKKEPEGISVNPLKIKLGTTIVWFNHDLEPITIRFTTKLGIACKAPVNFYSDLFGYYETGQIPQGGTASICFIYQGSYDYEVKRLVGKGEEISEGTIIAKE
jgi:hypothetical protein